MPRARRSSESMSFGRSCFLGWPWLSQAGGLGNRRIGSELFECGLAGCGCEDGTRVGGGVIIGTKDIAAGLAGGSRRGGAGAMAGASSMVSDGAMGTRVTAGTAVPLVVLSGYKSMGIWIELSASSLDGCLSRVRSLLL